MRVRDEGPRPLPELGDHLAHDETEARSGHARERGDLPAVPGPGPVEEPEADRRRGEERHRPDRDEIADLLLQDAVTPEEVVQVVERGPVDPATLAAGARCLAARRLRP